MFRWQQFWKTFYGIVIPFAILVTFRDAFVDYYFYRRAGSFRITFQYNLFVWVVWLSLAPAIVWLFLLIVKVRGKFLRFLSLFLLVIGASAIHQLVHHLIFLSNLEFLRLAWGSLMVTIFLTFLYALQLENARRRAQLRAAEIEKELEQSKLLQVRMHIEPDKLLSKLKQAKETIRVDVEQADQQLSDLADHLRVALKTISAKLQSLHTIRPADVESKPHIRMWILLVSSGSILVGTWITAARILDDVYVWRYITLPWQAYWTLWFSWLGVAFLTPAIFWMSRRYGSARYFIFHAAACILFFCTINICLQIKDRPLDQWQTFIPTALTSGLGWGFKFDVYGAVLITALTMNRLESKRKEDLRIATNETLLVSARLEALKMQLHPHFLFNALNSIIEMIHQDAKQAAELLEKLEQFLQMTLQVENVKDVPLRKELEFVQCYLDMQKVRFPKRLSVTMNIDKNSIDSPVPTLILQPLVENAIRHGIARNPQAGQIWIQSRLIPGSLQLKIRDTGPGLPSEVQEGIGILNTKHRLAQLYGEHFRFEMQNEQSGGLVVYLEIPCP